MSDPLFVAFISVGGVLAGSLITGLFTILSSSRSREYERVRVELLRVHKDLVAFYKLEEIYSERLAGDSRTSEALKREVRKTLRERGEDSPSREATQQKSKARIEQLSN